MNKKVKVLRTENVLEFCDSQFNEFCSKNRIERHKTCTYTTQQNRVAERKNKILMKNVRCLLDESCLEEKLWAEEATTAAYLVNCSPSSVIDHNVSEQLWLERRPCYKYLRRFGFVAYVHQDQGKLKPRALKEVFLGYPQGTKGYKIWLLDEEKRVISRNVVSKDDVLYKNLKTNGEQIDKTGLQQSDKVVTKILKEQELITQNVNEGGMISLSSNEYEDEET